MNTLTYPQAPAWGWPTTTLPTSFPTNLPVQLSLKDPNQWLPRKLVERVARQLPEYAQKFFGGQSTTPPDEAALEQIGENHEPVMGVRSFVLLRQRGRQVLTALRTSDRLLNLITWRVNADGAVVQTGESGVQPEQIMQIDMAHAGKFVVACRTVAHHLKLISWDVANTGAIYRAGESVEQRPAIRAVKIVAINDEQLVTACITHDGQLQLTPWRLNADNSLTALHEAVTQTTFLPGERIREVVLGMQNITSAATTPQKHLVAAVRTKSGQVRLLAWIVAENGVLTFCGESASNDLHGTQLQLTAGAPGQWITTLRTPEGHLRLNLWQLVTERRVIEPLTDHCEKTEIIRHQTMLYRPDSLIVALALPKGRLKLVDWQITTAGDFTRRRESTPIAAASGSPLLCPELLDGNAPIFTGLRTSRGALKLLTWRG